MRRWRLWSEEFGGEEIEPLLVMTVLLPLGARMRSPVRKWLMRAGRPLVSNLRQGFSFFVCVGRDDPTLDAASIALVEAA